MKNTAAAVGSWLSTELLGSLVCNGGEQACLDSTATAAASGFLRKFLRNALLVLLFLLLLWWLSGLLFWSRLSGLLSRL